jgi:hypothetical protein
MTRTSTPNQVDLSRATIALKETQVRAIIIAQLHMENPYIYCNFASSHRSCRQGIQISVPFQTKLEGHWSYRCALHARTCLHSQQQL